MDTNYTSPHELRTSAYNEQARKLILNVLHFFQQSKTNPELLLGHPIDIATKALNIGINTFARIKKTGVYTPKKRPGRPSRLPFDDFDKNAVQSIIQEFYKNRQVKYIINEAVNNLHNLKHSKITGLLPR